MFWSLREKSSGVCVSTGALRHAVLASAHSFRMRCHRMKERTRCWRRLRRRVPRIPLRPTNESYALLPVRHQRLGQEAAAAKDGLNKSILDFFRRVESDTCPDSTLANQRLASLFIAVHPCTAGTSELVQRFPKDPSLPKPQVRGRLECSKQQYVWITFPRGTGVTIRIGRP
jgi:hypothetical protein